MSYRVLMLGTLIPTGHQMSLFRVEYTVVYEPKRAISVAYADKYCLTNITCGHQLTCF